MLVVWCCVYYWFCGLYFLFVCGVFVFIGLLFLISSVIICVVWFGNDLLVYENDDGCDCFICFD